MEIKNYITVATLNTLIKNKLEGDYDLKNIYVKGEISNWKEYSSGFFFNLIEGKDSVISCVIWRNNYMYLPFEPKSGDQVVVLGSVSVYVGRGTYNLTVRTMEQFGQGAKLLALEALKKKLMAEGLFDPSHKLEIPAFPKKIGLIVGASSAAEADLITNINRRWPICEIYVFPSLVQGKEAPKDLLRALKLAESYPLDTLIIARGGGSNEDLDAFNDEALARELYSCKIPCISAVGHEIDTTLIDYVSDLRVSTPTGAAEAATPDQNEIRSILMGAEESLDTSIGYLLSRKKEMLLRLSERPFFKNPASSYEKAIEQVNQLSSRLEFAITHQLEKKVSEITNLEGKLKSLNPTNVISRGYSMTTNDEGKVITSSTQIKVGEKLHTVLKDGIIISTVSAKE